MQKGFTLIELLIVIAVVAVLATVVLITLNPSELLKQARDSNRVADIKTLDTALTFYLSDASSTALANYHLNPFSASAYGSCYMGPSSATPWGIAINNATSGCGGRYRTVLNIASGTRSIDGTGWLPVNLTVISSGAPLGNLPIDPSNSGLYFYAYAATTSQTTSGYVLTAAMESAKFGSLMATDGGPSSTVYEVGTMPNLAL
jgi:prepilin-type N-terminal cleavage/methylation domain-containing protein